MPTPGNATKAKRNLLDKSLFARRGLKSAFISKRSSCPADFTAGSTGEPSKGNINAYNLAGRGTVIIGGATYYYTIATLFAYFDNGGLSYTGDVCACGIGNVSIPPCPDGANQKCPDGSTRTAYSGRPWSNSQILVCPEQ
jgi:hypothetical protein